MRQFTKTLPARHPLVTELMDAHGPEAYAYLTILLELAHEIGAFDLTLAILARECRIKNPRLSRIFPDMKIIFGKAQVSLGILKKPEESSTELNKVDLSSTSEGQNPHGSTRDLERSERLERGETNTQARVCENPESKEFSKKGHEYAIASNNPNMSNWGWVGGYLAQQFTEIRNSRPDIPPEALLQVWRECCDDASSNTVGSPKWYRTAFANKMRDWRPGVVSKPFSHQAGTKVDPRQIVMAEHRQERSGRIL